MNYEMMEWSEDYEIGVGSIDRAHQEFFRIIKRMLLLSGEPAKHKWLAKEGIKFLKIYVANHFTEEESYMRSIGYGALEQHCNQHQIFRNNVLPRMESHLAIERYSQEAIEKYLQILRLWFARHILVHDKAIARSTDYS